MAACAALGGLPLTPLLGSFTGSPFLFGAMAPCGCCSTTCEGLRQGGPGTGKKAIIPDVITLARVLQPGALKAPYVVRERSSHVKCAYAHAVRY